MNHFVLLFLSLILTCSFALSNVALMDEKSGVTLTMIGPVKPGDEGALSLELTIKNRREKYYIVVTDSENKETICSKEFTALDSDNLKCSYDKSILKHGDNNFVITVYSMDQDKIVLRTVGHFFYQGYNLNGVDVTDVVTRVIENRHLLLTAGGLTVVAGVGRSLSRLLRSRGGAVNVVSSLPAAVTKPSITTSQPPFSAYKQQQNEWTMSGRDVPVASVDTDIKLSTETAAVTTQQPVVETAVPTPVLPSVTTLPPPPPPVSKPIQSVVEIVRKDGDEDGDGDESGSKPSKQQAPSTAVKSTYTPVLPKQMMLPTTPSHSLSGIDKMRRQVAQKINTPLVRRTTGILLTVILGATAIKSAQGGSGSNRVKSRTVSSSSDNKESTPFHVSISPVANEEKGEDQQQHKHRSVGSMRVGRRRKTAPKQSTVTPSAAPTTQVKINIVPLQTTTSSSPPPQHLTRPDLSQRMFYPDHAAMRRRDMRLLNAKEGVKKVVRGVKEIIRKRRLNRQ